MIESMIGRGPGRLVALVALSCLSGSLGAVGLSDEQRLQRLERILENQSLSEMVLQIQGLQREVQRLRGELELQGHALETLSNRQRELYMDLERRLGGSPAPVAAPAPVVAAPAVTPPPAPAAAVPPAPAPVPVVAEPEPVPPVAVAPGDPTQEESAYQQAFELLKRGSYSEAAAAFRGFLGAYPGSRYADNAQYWLGEASYVTRDFDAALAEFTRVVERYPNSAKVPGALLKIGYVRYELRDWTGSRRTLEDLVARFPRSTEARLAQQRLDLARREGH
jgi:tol-pal system protein YbgF